MSRISAKSEGMIIFSNDLPKGKKKNVAGAMERNGIYVFD